MKQIWKWISRYQRVWAGILLAGILAVVLAWTGYTITKTVNGQSKYLQVHDYYNEEQVMDAQNPQTGWYQQIKAGPDTPLYGVRLYFDTHNRVVRGTMYVDLLDQNMQVLTSGRCDMTEILGKDFQAIVFDQPVFSQQDGTVYSLHIYYEPETAEDVVGLIYGTGEMPQVELDANGIPIVLDPEQAVSANAANPNFPLTDAVQPQSTAATAAMQYIVNYSGQIGWKLFAPVALVLFIAVMGGWALAVCFKAKTHMVFAWFALFLGVAFAMVTPPFAAPDEYTHVAGAYSLANEVLGYPGVMASYDDNGREVYSLPMRACDAPYMRNKSGEIGVFAYKQMLDHPGGFGNDGQTTENVRVVAPAHIQLVQYFPQMIGIVLARLLGLGFYPMLFLGRICSVLAYTLLGMLAIKAAPFAKNVFFAAALLPMSLELAGSFSADTMVLGLTYLFTALCLQGIFEANVFSWKKKLALILVAALFAPAKAIYILLIALCLLIRPQNLGGTWHSRGYKLLVCVVSFISWQLVNLETVVYMLRSIDTERIGLAAMGALVLGIVFAGAWLKWRNSAIFRKVTMAAGVAVAVSVVGVAIWVLGNSGLRLTPEEMAAGIQPNGESIYTFSIGYIIANPSATIKLLLQTVSQQLPTYLQGLVGALPGEPIVHKLEISWLLTLGLVGVLLCSALRSQAEPVRIHTKGRCMMVAILAGVTCLVVLAALIWTPINAVTIFGIQGRYFLPVLPLLLLLIGENQAICTRRDISVGLNLCSGILTGMVILQSMALFCGV